MHNYPFPLKSSCTDFMVDIGPNLEVWPCFPLSGETAKLEQFQTLAELPGFFANAGSAERLLYEGDCATCEERLNKACDGGCKGFQILRRASNEPTVNRTDQNPMCSQTRQSFEWVQGCRDDPEAFTIQ
jgi:hypothetical protein